MSLYKSNLSEIKYFQNEITSIESKILALRVSLLASEDESLRVALRAMSYSERNDTAKQTVATLENAEKSVGILAKAREIIKSDSSDRQGGA